MPRGPKGEKRPGDAIGAAVMVAEVESQGQRFEQAARCFGHGCWCFGGRDARGRG